MTELQFQKRIPNDKNETIFHFCAITNVFWNSNDGWKRCMQRFDGDVIANVTTKMVYFSNHALKSLVNDYLENVVKEFKEEIQKLDDDAGAKFIRDKCEETVRAKLFEECEKLEQVI